MWFSRKTDIALSDEKGAIFVHEIDGGEQLFQFHPKTHKSAVKSMQLLEPHGLLVTGSEDKKVVVWDIPKVWRS